MNDYLNIDSEAPQALSKINSAALINFRMDAIIKDANRHARAGQYMKWNDDLDCLWWEVGSDVKEGSPEEDRFKELDKKVIEALSDSPSLKQGFERYSPEDLSKLAKQKIALKEKALFIRRLINRQGKGTAYDDGEDEDFE